ncbi:protein-glutamate methylesterase/protein-glutamine glutaminase [Chondromyces apiculatus]|uniref:Protein-glutamate methylesterase/protein-glutamine glutaminase n=1 Tax=Chondromyces apiculatus DSM 436 TaxID=1192034 RepID=A0A017SUR1_9BACT|nr:chemotaxis response regulator protein-glutamate methylesterase [Chondromyces apiculatus]EYF00350.1 Chemotaxis response regulator protein-glutamate methylesterase CheB [Chondromyces apiculatus DSM 436]
MSTQVPLRALVVDDSAYNRRNIAEILGGSDEIEVVGKAGDGDEALRQVAQLKPDVITLDLEMPRMDGFTFLRILMARQPTPVIVVSSYAQKENVFKALELGAVDFVAKPDRQFSPDATIRKEIIQKVLLVRYLKPRAPALPRAVSAPPGQQPQRPITETRVGLPLRHLVAIGSSTGGPTALLEIFNRIPERFPGAIVIAQHMPDKFTRTFAERLDRRGGVRVVEAQDNDQVISRKAYVCPGRMCMDVVVTPGSGNALQGDVRVKVGPPVSGDRYVPSADRLFRSVAQVAGTRAVGVILTGMGDDGVIGARAIRAAGGTVVAESEETAVVYGMPGAAVRAGVVNESLPLSAIGDFIALLA